MTGLTTNVNTNAFSVVTTYEGTAGLQPRKITRHNATNLNYLVAGRMKATQGLCRTTGGLSALLHLQSAPRRCEVISWGYNTDTPSGRRDILATTMLCFLLVATAFAVNGFTSAMQLVNVQTELCDTQAAKLVDNRDRMHNATNYEAAFSATSCRVNLANDAFVSANYTYNRLRTAYTWPEAYEMSEDERQVGAISVRVTGRVGVVVELAVVVAPK